MADLLKNNPMALRHCILFEVLQGTSIEEAYSKFCKTIGDDFMEYREFDFWYYRFLNGECDPNFERNKNKNIYELSDMPIDVMEKIVGNLDIFDRISLSKTSRSFQTFVEDQKLFHHTLGLEVCSSRAIVSLSDWVNIQYTKIHTGCLKNFNGSQKFFEDVPFLKKAVLDLKSILKNPKLRLDTLEIRSILDKENVSNELEDAFKFTHYLNVKILVLNGHSPEQMFKILPTLKPGYLETINIFSANPNLDSLNTVFETEQWKQAKWFGMDGACFIWPLHHLYHFEQFTVILKKMSVEEVRQMKEVLFASPNFEECYVLVVDNSGANAIEEEFGDYFLHEEDSSELKKTYQYPIPNSTEYFEIKVDRFNFVVTRKNR